MFSLSSPAITTAISEGSKETKILFCAIKILADNPDISITTITTDLNQQVSLLTGDKDLTYSSIEHYYYCAKMFLRLFNALNNKVDGYTYFYEKDYVQLLCSGITLCNKVYQILRIRSDSQFLFIMKRTADFLRESTAINIKESVNTFLNYEFEKMPAHEFLPPQNTHHDNIRNVIGMQYLRKLGCVFVTKEALLEKRNKAADKPGLRLDVYGWKDDSTIIGMEVKTKLDDFKGTLMDERFGKYSEYCNEFYILTTQKSVFKAAQLWCTYHKGTAALYYDGNESYKLLETKMQPSQRKITDKMIQKAQDVMTTKIRKSIGETYLDSSDCSPSSVLNKITLNISKEIFLENAKSH